MNVLFRQQQVYAVSRHDTGDHKCESYHITSENDLPDTKEEGIDHHNPQQPAEKEEMISGISFNIRQLSLNIFQTAVVRYR